MHRPSLIFFLASCALDYGRETLTERLLRSIPAKHGPIMLRPPLSREVMEAFLNELPHVSIETRIRRTTDEGVVLNCTADWSREAACIELQEREPAPEFLYHPKVHKTGKRPAARWGARSREQRTRR